ncbi:hypothetical protein L3Q82_021928 [Scortum barcoo]|uniref:Uncharacterized protein n=1 Tax=Scortum barcoo TaxID=214431 RepID=A0ACB8WZZ7_9TELE|nr:hypothetical protein L3Q82_021928 [Scortum barcoo]
MAASCTTLNHKVLQRVLKTAQHIIRTELLSTEDLYTQQCRKKANKIIKDPSHPSHKLFCLLPSGHQFCSRLRDSFIPQGHKIFELSSQHHHFFHSTITLSYCIFYCISL